MSNVSKKKLSLPTVQQPAARWAFVLAVCASLGVVVSYYWRVFYGLDARGVSAAGVTGLCVGLAVLAGAAALALRRVRDFAKKGAVCILLCGVLFTFANPPMQTPDETDHYLRTYAISMGRFDFDAQRGYPEDVDELVAAFPGAWVNAHTSAGLGTDPDTHAEQPFNSAGYALKQYGKDGRVESIRDSFEQYLTWLYRDSVPQRVTEPVSFLILPFLPGALGHGTGAAVWAWRTGLPVRRAAREPAGPTRRCAMQRCAVRTNADLRFCALCLCRCRSTWVRR